MPRRNLPTWKTVVFILIPQVQICVVQLHLVVQSAVVGSGLLFKMIITKPLGLLIVWGLLSSTYGQGFTEDEQCSFVRNPEPLDVTCGTNATFTCCIDSNTVITVGPIITRDGASKDCGEIPGCIATRERIGSGQLCLRIEFTNVTQEDHDRLTTSCRGYRRGEDPCDSDQAELRVHGFTEDEQCSFVRNPEPLDVTCGTNATFTCCIDSNTVITVGPIITRDGASKDCGEIPGCIATRELDGSGQLCVGIEFTNVTQEDHDRLTTSCRGYRRGEDPCDSDQAELRVHAPTQEMTTPTQQPLTWETMTSTRQSPTWETMTSTRQSPTWETMTPNETTNSTTGRSSITTGIVVGCTVGGVIVLAVISAASAIVICKKMHHPCREAPHASQNGPQGYVDPHSSQKQDSSQDDTEVDEIEISMEDEEHGGEMEFVVNPEPVKQPNESSELVIVKTAPLIRQRKPYPSNHRQGPGPTEEQAEQDCKTNVVTDFRAEQITRELEFATQSLERMTSTDYQGGIQDTPNTDTVIDLEGTASNEATDSCWTMSASLSIPVEATDASSEFLGMGGLEKGLFGSTPKAAETFSSQLPIPKSPNYGNLLLHLDFPPAGNDTAEDNLCELYPSPVPESHC